MPQRTLKPCAARACNALTRNAKYCDAHLDLSKAWGTRQGSGRGGRPWRRLRDQVLARDQYLCRCEECVQLGRVRAATEVDHIVALAQGGTDYPSNLRAIHHDCHKLKTAREAQAARGSG
ncbi:5-methylcytosine-specific restriction protein A [Pseudomonas graminis]|uniref:HNH endonuclease n=1 Tax=Pseudomonas graminis TaxID=158627 RepID=UPI00105EC4F9|nr:HNH endonuclease signature motif containing protein [Pseudomonas graminis]TDV43769.1 5-methylcytosine-specific restriction protein A [Pseudomonas graminis]